MSDLLNNLSARATVTTITGVSVGKYNLIVKKLLKNKPNQLWIKENFALPGWQTCQIRITDDRTQDRYTGQWTLLNDFLACACTVPSMRQFLSFYTIFLSITLCWRHGAFVNTGRVSYRDYRALRQAPRLRKTHGKDTIIIDIQ